MRFKDVDGFIPLLCTKEYNDMACLSCLTPGARACSSVAESRFQRTRELVAKAGGGANFATNFAGLVAVCCADYCSARYHYHFNQLAQEKRLRRRVAADDEARAGVHGGAIVAAVPLPPRAPLRPLPDAVLVHLADLLPPLQSYLHLPGAPPHDFSARSTHAPAGEPAVQVPAPGFVEEADALWGTLASSSALCPISRVQIFFRTSQRAVASPPGTLRAQQQAAVGYHIALVGGASGEAQPFSHSRAAPASRKSLCSACGGSHRDTYPKCPKKTGMA